MSEVYLPSLPKFEIDPNIEDCFDRKEVYFVLGCGVLKVVCSMKAECVVDTYSVNVDENPQNDIDRDFKYLKVGETAVSIDCSDIDLVGGQQIELTETQIQKLNEILKENMVLA